MILVSFFSFSCELVLIANCTVWIMVVGNSFFSRKNCRKDQARRQNGIFFFGGGQAKIWESNVFSLGRSQNKKKGLQFGKPPFSTTFEY